MASITSSTANPTTATSQTSLAELAGGQQMGRNDFLKLLVTQLKNQDPLKPMDNTEFVAELAQFSQLDQSTQQVELLQKSLDQQNEVMQFSLLPMIGRSVKVEGGLMQLGASPVPMTYTLDHDAGSVKIAVYNEAGQLVRTLDVGAQAHGDQSVQWDGRNQFGVPAAPGVYRYEVAARDVAGAAVPVQTTSVLTVTGIRNDNGTPQLVSGNRMINRDAILELR